MTKSFNCIHHQLSQHLTFILSVTNYKIRYYLILHLIISHKYFYKMVSLQQQKIQGQINYIQKRFTNWIFWVGNA